MKVLVACEFSGIVRDAFIAHGHDAISCDLLPTERPGPHIQGDVIKLLRRSPRWFYDLIIAFPDCTKLCVSGNRWYGKGKNLHHQRIDAARWTEMFYELAKQKSKKVAFENPVGVLPTLTRIGTPEYIQPWQFGHGETKKTGLWLHNLKKLAPTNIVDGRSPRVHYASPGPERWKVRSRTLPGIAKAMAEQWGVE